MTSVFVTGGTGFLGGYTVRALLAGEAVRVRCAGHLGGRSPAEELLSRDGVQYVEVDVRDRSGLERCASGQDMVVHCAAVTDARTPAERRRQEQVNVGGTQNLIRACLRQGVRRLLYVSSTSAIGISPDPDAPADEDCSYNLADLDLPYGETKRRAEMKVLAANTSSLETVVVNPGFAFGGHRSGYRGGEVVNRILERRLVVCTNGGMSIVHVKDVADGIRRALLNGRPGERYILSGENLTFRRLAEIVREVSGTEATIVQVPDWVRDAIGYWKDSIGPADGHPFRPHLHGEYAYQFYSSSKAERELGYESRSFRRIVTDYLSNSDAPDVGPAQVKP